MTAKLTHSHLVPLQPTLNMDLVTMGFMRGTAKRMLETEQGKEDLKEICDFITTQKVSSPTGDKIYFLFGSIFILSVACFISYFVFVVFFGFVIFQQNKKKYFRILLEYNICIVKKYVIYLNESTTSSIFPVKSTLL